MIEKSRVYDLLKQVPRGKITTYKAIADKLGSKAYRMVGKIVGANQDFDNIACHRVVKNNGEVGGYVFGTDQKIALLESEGLKIKKNKIVNFNQKLYRFNEV